MLIRYLLRLQGCPSTCIVPLPVYSSVMRTSYSSLLRSWPMYQAQLKSVDFRSLAPGAGLKYATPRPRPPPCPPPPAGAAPRPPPCAAAGAAAACANTEDGAPIVRVAAIATPVHINFLKAM